jgi:hypothetical protein
MKGPQRDGPFIYWWEKSLLPVCIRLNDASLLGYSDVFDADERSPPPL